MRHLREFEKCVLETGATTYCLFIAPSIHRDTLNTFWIANKYEFEGSPQKIIPITIAQFTGILKALLRLRKKNREFTHNDLLALYDSVIEPISSIDSSEAWLRELNSKIDFWLDSMVKLTI